MARREYIMTYIEVEVLLQHTLQHLKRGILEKDLSLSQWENIRKRI